MKPKTSLYVMLTVLVLLGILQFFNLPAYLDVLLISAALIFGSFSLIKTLRLNHNTIGFLSILTVLISIAYFLIVRGPNVNLSLAIGVLTSLSVLGLFFAIISEKIWANLLGILLNGSVLLAAYFLLLAIGISEP